MKKTLLRSLALAAVGSLFVVGSAMALPQLEISATDATTVTISDTDNDGIVSFYQDDFGVFDLSMAAGTTKPQDGSAAVPMMHLGGLATTNTSGTLTVKFTETDFGPMADNLTGFISSMNGASGIQSLEVYYDTDNVAFAETTKIADINTLNTNVIFGSIPEASPFSLTMVATMTVNNGTASFDNTVAPVPEPATMLLFGAGLAGIAGLRRKKSKKV